MTSQADNGDSRFLPVDRRKTRMGPWWHRLAFIQRKLHHGLTGAIDALQLPGHARVLDFGCADQPYRGFLPQDAEYIGADLPGNPQADIFIRPDGSLEQAAASCDAVLSTQVLEHVADPHLYLAEAWRVLKPGGRLLISTHGLMIYHADPVDYWRWTGEGLRKILQDAGFEVLAFEGIMGLAPVGLQFFQDAILQRLPRMLARPFILCIQGLISLFDHLHSNESRSHNALVFIAIARKVDARK
jgi:SAM-dependent methyltransferase